MSKYEDLAEAIHNDGIDAYWDEILAVLHWLDEHPDQVPGRTITESEWSEYVNSTNGKYLAGADLLEKAGITVVPDPEPTNAEKLEIALKTHFGPGAFTVEGGSLSRFLDGIGVKAPGGDDDH